MAGHSDQFRAIVKAVKLNPTWTRISTALAQAPPDTGDHNRRLAVLEAIDSKLTSRLTSYDEELVAFYHSRIESTVAHLQNPPPSEGLELLKLYSSSVILRSATETLLVDFCQGPVDNRGEPEAVADAGHRFYWPADQRRRLADAVDVMLITHEHHDHADYSLARLMSRASKPVIGPDSLRLFWSHGDGTKNRGEIAIESPPYNAALPIRGAVLHAFRGAQYTGYRERERPSPLPPPRPEDTEHAVFVIETGGRTVLHAGDNWVGLDRWLATLADRGVKPDVVLGLGMAECPESIRRSIQNPVYVPVHDLELKHSGGGSRIARHLARSNSAAPPAEVSPQPPFARSGPFVLFWGEKIFLKRHSERSGRPAVHA